MGTPAAGAEAAETVIANAADAAAAEPAPVGTEEAMAAFAAEMDAKAQQETPAEPPVGDLPAPPAPNDTPEVTPPPVVEPPPAEPTPEQKAAQELRAARRMLAQAERAKREIAAATAGSKDALLAEFRANPAKVLEATGLSIEQFLHAIAGTTPAPPKVEDEIAALRKAHDDLKAQLANAEQEKANAARSAQIHGAIKAAGPKFPLINAGDAHELVTDLMVAYYDKHGAPLDETRAAREVEAYLGRFVPKAKTPATAAASPALARPASPTLATMPARDAPRVDDGLPIDSDARYEALLKDQSWQTQTQN